MKRTFTQLFLFLLLFSFVSANAQQSSESHNFITYDTTYNVGYAGLAFILRITRPANLFTANSPDTASRPGIIMMGGVGEIGTNPGLTAVNGPHYWLAHGWDGGVTLGNGKHYPIIISVQAYQAWPQTRELLAILTYILNTYHIKRNSVHLTGLSMGAFGWTALICHQSTPGSEDGMKLVTSIAALEGQSNSVSTSVIPNELPGYTSFGVWAQKYKGKFFGLEGVADWRNVASVSKAMNAAVPGSAYFSYQNIGGGYHCCWNSMYDPSATNWTSVGDLGPNNARGSDANTMGTYKGPSSIFQWMIRQGDTAMVGSGNSNDGNNYLTANAGTDQTITLPTNSVTLSGSGTDANGKKVKSFSWRWINGPSQYTISNSDEANAVLSNLVTGTYTFRLTVTGKTDATAYNDVHITVNPAPANQPPIANAGTDQTITLPANSLTLNGSGRDPDGKKIKSFSWRSINGPSQYAISNSNIPNPVVSNLVEGTYTFRFTVTDDADAAAYNDVNVTVKAAPANQAPVANAGTDQTITLPANSLTLNGSGTDPEGKKIKSYSWRSINGPSQYTISNSNIPNPVLSNLITGTYTFRLTVTDNAGATAYDDININVNAALVSSSPKTIPGRIQAENYDAMYGILTQNTDDVNGGKNISYFTNGSWINYNVNVVTAGTYTVNFRVATPNSNTGFQLRNATGKVLAIIQLVKPTGGYQSWQTVGTTVTLPAGNQTLQILSTSVPYLNINWMEFIGVATQPVPTPVPTPAPASGKLIPGRITGASYDKMNGVVVQATSDANGGQNLGWISNGSWMNYNVTVAAAGTYKVSFRVATPNYGVSFQLKIGNGTVLTTLYPGSTGGYQTWQTISTTVSLPSGNQTIGIFSNSNPMWNFNWMEFTNTKATTQANTTQTSTVSAQMLNADTVNETFHTGSSFTIYPNPVKNNMSIDINNSHMGKMSVSVINQSGNIIKTYSLIKDQTFTHLDLASDYLTTGTYFIRVQIGSWTEIRKLLKL